MGQAGSPGRVLFVDPDPERLARCVAIAEQAGFACTTARYLATALARMGEHPHQVVAAHPDHRDENGQSLMEAICIRFPLASFVALSRGGLDRLRSHRLEAAIAAWVQPALVAGELIAAIRDAFAMHARRVRAPGIEGARVLLVEDNPGDALLVIEHLAELVGTTIQHVTGVEAALEAMRQATFDFVISDLTLPDATGLDAIRRLQPAAPDTTLVVLSGIADEDIAIQALQYGAQDYLVKGEVDASTLRRTLRHAHERKQATNRLAHLARHDPLTGVANRVALRERIEAALANAVRRNLAFAVLFIDLDRFKAINDTCGHDAGDAVLCEVSARMQELVRSSDVV
ncbi:MAG: diguanylate cyclase, partial [Deltaproteobacteria bacterium]|nr:diguanylate cyclase [Deltaproteobacteria bacterium]